MSFAEKTLGCINCKKEFIYTVQNQEFNSSRGYPNEPLTCPTCRRARKSSSLSGGNTKTNVHSDSYFK
jgi:hypothetical protein